MTAPVMAVYGRSSGDLVDPEDAAPYLRRVWREYDPDLAGVEVPEELRVIREHVPPCTNDPESWFPNSGNAMKRPVRLCRTCPVVVECLRYAMRYDVAGVWGASSQTQRRAWQQELGIDPIPVNDLVPYVVGAGASS